MKRNSVSPRLKDSKDAAETAVALAKTIRKNSWEQNIRDHPKHVRRWTEVTECDSMTKDSS